MSRVKGWPFAIFAFVTMLSVGLGSFGGSYVGPNSWWFSRLFAPIPYKDVQVVEVQPYENSVVVTASFIKVRCIVREFVPIGHYLGQTEMLKFRDIDGLPENYNRTPGRQTLRVEVMLRHQYDFIEFRTRHFCADRTTQDENGNEIITGAESGVIVDKVFARIDPSERVAADSPISGHPNFVGPRGGY